MSRVLITPVAPDEKAAALNILFGNLAPEYRPLHIARALAAFAEGELDPDHLLIARFSPHGPPVAAAVAQVLPGACAVVWPPRTEDVLERPAVEKALLRALLSRLKASGVKLVQCFLAPTDAEGAEIMARNGFHHMTRISTLRRELVSAKPAAPIEQEGAIEFRPWSMCETGVFETTLMRTYEASLDCPELNEMRGDEEVMAGYRRSSPDPSRWWLIRQLQEPVGVIILGDGAGPGVWDLGYLGIVAEARGKGIGRRAMSFIIAEAAAAGNTALTLIVDSRNAPAIALYQSFDFEIGVVQDVFYLTLAR